MQENQRNIALQLKLTKDTISPVSFYCGKAYS